MTEIPKFKVPFRFTRGAAEVVEQGSEEEIAQCVEAILRTRIGSRDDQIEFGIEDPTFQDQIDIEDIREVIQRWEPRAEFTLTQEKLDEMITRIVVHLEG